MTQEKLPEGAFWNRQDTLYHATGWKKEEAIVYQTTTLATECPSEITTNKTSFEGYDAYGRVGTIVAASRTESSMIPGSSEELGSSSRHL